MASSVTQNGAAQHLQARLNDPKTAEALARLLDRVETIESLLEQGPGVAATVADSVDEFVATSGTDLEVVLQHALQVANKLQNQRLVNAITRLLDQPEAVELLASAAEQGPGMLATMADTLDEMAMNAHQAGLDVDTLLKNSLQIAARLQNQRTLDALTRLMDQTEALELLASAAEQGPGMLATMADTLDEMAMNAHQAGLDVDTLLKNSLQIAAKLQNPRMVAALDKLLDQVEAVELLASAAEQGPGMAAIVADSMDEFARTSDIDFDILLDKGMDALLRTINLVESPQFDALLNSGVLEPSAIAVVGKVGKALADSSSKKITPVGPMALLKAMGDPDVQRGLGFLVSVGRNFGQELETTNQ